MHPAGRAPYETQRCTLLSRYTSKSCFLLWLESSCGHFSFFILCSQQRRQQQPQTAAAWRSGGAASSSYTGEAADLPTLGVLGGGQLGKMLAIAAVRRTSMGWDKLFVALRTLLPGLLTLNQVPEWRPWLQCALLQLVAGHTTESPPCPTNCVHT